MPIRGSPNGAAHFSARFSTAPGWWTSSLGIGGRHQSVRGWTSSIGTGGRHQSVLLGAITRYAHIMGCSFVFLRPLIVLLPEDQRFTAMTPEQLKALNPQLFTWVGMVFRSWGAFAIGLGTMMSAIAGTAYRHGDRWAWWALAVAGVLTFSIFLTVNVLLGSDFKFVIGLLFATYLGALWYGRDGM